MVYRELASFYDRLMQDAPYNQWTSFTYEVLKKNNKFANSIIDLGCGTGEITTRLARDGFQIIGVDYSTDMLALAQQKAISQNLSIQWIHQDLRELQGFSGLDMAISYCDVINYITNLDDVGHVFQNVASCLKPGGIFIFDIHSINHVEQNMINHSFSDVDDDFSYIWDCTEGDNKGEMFHDLTFFILEEDGKYRRFDEFHHQHTYPIDTYQQLLQRAGFENIQIYSDFNIENGNYTEEAERIFFFAVKRSRF